MLVSPTAKRSRTARPDPFARPLDHALERLRVHELPYRADVRRFDIWQSVCPSCLVGDWMLTVRERGLGGEINLRCAAGCGEIDIRRALERDPADARVEALEASADEAWAICENLREIAAAALDLASELAQQRAGRGAVAA